MEGIVLESTRKIEYLIAEAMAPDPAEGEAARRQALEAHFGGELHRWASLTGAEASESRFEFDTAFMDVAVLDQWQASLETAGYVVTRIRGMFYCDLQA